MNNANWQFDETFAKNVIYDNLLVMIKVFDEHNMMNTMMEMNRARTAVIIKGTDTNVVLCILMLQKYTIYHRTAELECHLLKMMRPIFCYTLKDVKHFE